MLTSVLEPSSRNLKKISYAFVSAGNFMIEKRNDSRLNVIAVLCKKRFKCKYLVKSFIVVSF